MKREPLPLEYRRVLAGYGLDEIDLSGLYLMTYARSEYLCRDGVPLEYLLIVVNGSAKVTVTGGNGKTLLIRLYSGQGIIGELEFMLGREFTRDVQATSPVACIGIPVNVYRGYLRSSAPFLNYMGASLAQKLHRQTSNSSLNILVPVKTRLCAFILLTNVAGEFSENLAEVADLLGVSYRHLLRVLRQLCDEGMLAKSGRAYKIVDSDALADQAEDYCQEFE